RDGGYAATLAGGTVEDLAGNAYPDDLQVGFSWLTGDLNKDGQVSISDFIDLASNFGKTNAIWSDGDLNLDGTVTIADFIDLAANFGNRLPPPAAMPQPASAVETPAVEGAATHLESKPRKDRLDFRRPARRIRHHHRRAKSIPDRSEAPVWLA